MHDPAYLFFKTNFIARFVNPVVGYLLVWVISYQEARKEESPLVSSVVATIVGLAGFSMVIFIELVMAELVLNMH